MVRVFKKSKQNPLMLMSCAIALGQLADINDREAVKLLKAYIKDGKDAQTRHFAYISLARIAAKDVKPEKNAEAQRAYATDTSRGRQ